MIKGTHQTSRTLLTRTVVFELTCLDLIVLRSSPTSFTSLHCLSMLLILIAAMMVKTPARNFWIGRKGFSYLRRSTSMPISRNMRRSTWLLLYLLVIVL